MAFEHQLPLVKPDRPLDPETDSSIISSLKPLGYYYLMTTETYKGLTEEETDLAEDLLVDRASDVLKYPAYLLHLKEANTEYPYGGVSKVYYVMLGQRYVGKGVLVIHMEGSEHYRCELSILRRTDTPESAAYNQRFGFPPYKRYGAPKTKRNNLARRRRKHNYSKERKTL